MSAPALDGMSTEQLVDRFVLLALDQDQALLHSDTRKYNRLFDQMEMVEAELKLRPNDERRALLPLYKHANAEVRLKAAKATLAVDPALARSMIETIANSRKYPQAGHAGMTLNALDRGIFKPT